MILAHENIPPRLIHALRESGVDVYSIKEHLRGISDEEVIEVSKQPSRIILTEDKDFGEWVFAHNVKSISVILLRYERQNENYITEILIDLIKEKGVTLFGKYTTMTVDKIRFREI